MYKISQHKEEIITNIISNIIWYMLIFIITHILLWIPLIKGVYNTINSNSYQIPKYAFILAGISVLLMFLLMSIVILLNIKLYKNKKKNNIATELTFTNLDIELYFINRNEIRTLLTYDCIVNKDGYEKFSKNIIWTGNKYNYTKIIESSGDFKLIDSNRNSSPYHYTIEFNKKLSLGDLLHFKLETSVSDDDFSMNPIFSHMIKQQTIKFTIRVTAPKNLLKNVKPGVYRDIARSIKVPNDIEINKNNVGNLIQYSYSVDNPTLLYNYCIEWDFE